MRAVVQRVKRASVTVTEGEGAPYVSGEIGAGLLVLAGVMGTDTDRDLEWMADKVVNLRIFEDDAGKMNRSILETGGSVLLVSQFTVCGDASRGRRPEFTAAAPPEKAAPMFDRLCERVAAAGVPVARGVFRAAMEVALVNDGPVTIILDSAARGGAAS